MEKKTYTEEQKRRAVDYYYSSSEICLRDVTIDLGYPSLRAINNWVRADKRYEEKRNHSRYTADKKSEVIEYCRQYPSATFDEIYEKFGIPKSRETLSEWRKQAGLSIRRRYTKAEKAAVVAYCRNNPSEHFSEIAELFGLPDEETVSAWMRASQEDVDGPWVSIQVLSEAVDSYFASPRASVRSVSDEYGISSKLLRKALAKDPRYHCGGNACYSEEQREEICKYAVDHPGETLTSVIKRFKYPHDQGVLRKWLAELYGMGPNSVSYGDNIRQAVKDHYYSNPGSSSRSVADLFGLGKDTVTRWVASDPRFDDDPRNRSKLCCAISEAVDYYYEHIGLSAAEVADMFGLHPASISNGIRRDPKYGVPEYYGHTDEQREEILSWIERRGEKTKRRTEAEEELGYRINKTAFRIWSSQVVVPKYEQGKSKAMPFGDRVEIVLGVVAGTWSAQEAALCHNIATATVRSWTRTYRKEGAIGLMRKSDLPPGGRPGYSLPDKDPGEFSKEDVELLIGAYKSRKFEADVCRAVVEILKKRPAPQRGVANKQREDPGH